MCIRDRQYIIRFFVLACAWIRFCRSTCFFFKAAFSLFPRLNPATILFVLACSFCGSSMAEYKSGWCLPTTIWNRLCQASLTLLARCFLFDSGFVMVPNSDPISPRLHDVVHVLELHWYASYQSMAKSLQRISDGGWSGLVATLRFNL